MTSTIRARATIYNGIQMRSRLEAGFAAWLDARHIAWEYEPCAFADQDGQYLPDFRLLHVPCLWRDTPTTVYAEVKPNTFDPTKYRGADYMTVNRQMSLIKASDPEAEFIVVQPARVCVLRPTVDHDYVPIGITFVRCRQQIGIATTVAPPFGREFWRLGES